jgi:hypothetical protein
LPAGRVELRFLALLAIALLLSVGAWRLASSWRERPLGSGLALHRSLMGDLRFAERTRTTERLNLGGVPGQRHTVEANPDDGAEAVGVLSRPDARPQFVWLVGARPGFSLDVVEPTDRTLALNLTSATDAVQKVTVLLNGHELGSRKLRKDRQPMTVRVAAPAEAQVPGRNRVQLDFTRVQEQVVEGEEVALPIAASLRHVRFLPPAEEAALRPGSESGARPGRRAQLATAEDGERQQSELVLPGGTSFGVGMQLPPAERVVLRTQLMRLELPLELWATPDAGPPTLLLRAEPGVSGPGTLSADLSPWAGRFLRLDGRVGSGVGSVALRGLALLVPADSEWVVDEALDAEERPLGGQLAVLRDGERPLLSWNSDGLLLEVDLASRRRQLFDLDEDPECTRDLSFTRPAAAFWLFQELTRAVHLQESMAEWASLLRWSRVRQ